MQRNEPLTLAQPPAVPKPDMDARGLGDRLARKLWRARKELHRIISPDPVRLHVLVAGMQRSGTNLLMELLDRSRWTDVYHETDPRAFSGYRMRPSAVIHELAARSRAPCFVIKALFEIDQIPRLMDEFAPARTLWIVRALDDCVRSAVTSFDGFASQIHRLTKDKSAADWRGAGMSDETQALLQSLDHPDLSDTDGAALIWYCRNVLFFERRLDRDSRVQLLYYEDLVTAPDRTMQGVFDFLDIPDWSASIGRRVVVRPSRASRGMPIDPLIREQCDRLRARYEAMRNTAHAGSPPVRQGGRDTLL